MTWSASARADACRSTGRPFVELSAEVAPPDRAVALDLERHLRAELASRGIDLCTKAPTSEKGIALVTLTVEHPAGGPFLARIEVVDAVTDKTVSRTIDLSHLTQRARLLAVAASTDELLRASWVELAVADAPPPKMPPPPALLAAVRSSLPQTNADAKPPAASVPTWIPSRFELGGRLFGTTFPGLREGLGVRAEGAYWIMSRVALLGAASGDYGFARSSTHGSTSSHALSVTLGAIGALLPRTGTVGLEGDVAVSVHAVHFRATSTSGGADTSANDAAVTARVGLSLWARTHRSRWLFGVAGLAALRPSVSTDVGRTVTGIQGFGGEVSLGVRFGL